MARRVIDAKPETVVIIAGEGPALPHCKSYVQSLGLAANVRFVGYLGRDSALLDCYKAGDLFVFSSKTETQGLVLLEAMALGVPVVALAHMGTTDIVKPERGARVAPEDESAFAQIVVGLLNDRPAREAMSQQARAYAASWSATAMTTRLAEFYSSAIARSPRGALQELSRSAVG
jgi:glycosyltransferase involved in cell wall biosynthesis